MTTTLDDLEKRVAALEAARPADLRRAVTKIGEHVEETRLRVSAVEVRLEGIASALALLTATQAEMRGELRADIANVRSELKAEIGSVRSELKAEMGSLRRDLPSIVAETMREVLKEQRGS
jgi:hypothetical protein